VTSESYRYNGNVIILFGKKDTVESWKRVFTNCPNENQIKEFIPEFKKLNMPWVRKLRVDILDGNHMAPEIDAQRFIDKAWNLICEN
jgi:hypothetical protein